MEQSGRRGHDPKLIDVLSFRHETLLLEPLNEDKCRELYQHLRRFVDNMPESVTVTRFKRSVDAFMNHGSPHSGPEDMQRRAVIRAGALVGCVFVRGDSSDLLGRAFPYRDNRARYPADYLYTELDLFLAKQFNNRTASPAYLEIPHILRAVYALHPDTARRTQNESVDGLEYLRSNQRRLVVIRVPQNNTTDKYVIYCSTCDGTSVPIASRAFLVLLMYGRRTGMGDDGIDPTLPMAIELPPRGAAVPAMLIARTQRNRCGSADDHIRYMERWRNGIGFHPTRFLCDICNLDNQPRFWFGDLPFSICETCFGHRQTILAQYLEREESRRERGEKHNFVQMFTAVFPDTL
jgi:hypothetical protein